MNGILKNYLANLTKEDLNNLALKNEINLSNEELDDTFNFIKDNYERYLNNPHDFDFTKMLERYSDDNKEKITKLISYYL